MEILLPVMLVALVVMMFLSSSRQRKALKQIEQLQASLVPGDRVMTTSGLRGTVVSTTENQVVLEIAPGVRTDWDLRVIRERLDPADGQDSPSESATAPETGDDRTYGPTDPA